MGLHSQCISALKISHADMLGMYELMEKHYENSCFQVFQKDLAEKDRVLILRDDTGNLQGFTTLKAYRFEINGIPIQLIFSGDTIIDKDHWGDMELHKAWIREIHSMLDEGIKDVFWLLISKGYKTYRFLPVYFKTFYPDHRTNTPDFEKRIMDHFCKYKYPDHYDPNSGIISFDGTRDYLKPGVADIGERHMKDLDISFFLEKNPGYLVGDELVCITRLNKENIRPRGLKYLTETGR